MELLIILIATLLLVGTVAYAKIASSYSNVLSTARSRVNCYRLPLEDADFR